jgi:dTDP-4-dehydrorhamnose 3,5-epimerase
MIFEETALKGSYVIGLTPKGDSRGWFVRTYCKKEFATIGHDKEWVQMNHSYSAEKGTVRGLHFQLSEHKEIKLVRCIAGAVYDVIVDIRKGSPSFLQWIGVELSAANKKMMYIPEGFAHGFQTLTNDAELLYHHSNYYSPAHELGLRYNDEQIKITWPLSPTVISERDQNHKLIDHHFRGIE